TLLLESLRAQGDASLRAAALGLARDMMDRIRANPDGRGSYDSDAAAAAACEPDCSAAALAAADLAAFAQSARTALPPAATASSIAFAPATGPTRTDRYVITVRW